MKFHDDMILPSRKTNLQTVDKSEYNMCTLLFIWSINHKVDEAGKILWWFLFVPVLMYKHIKFHEDQILPSWKTVSKPDWGKLAKSKLLMHQSKACISSIGLTSWKIKECDYGSQMPPPYTFVYKLIHKQEVVIQQTRKSLSQYN